MVQLHKMPEEMVVQILTRMTSKSLMRFKCICKCWYCLIISHRFVAKHLHFHNKLSSSTSILLKRSVIRRTEESNEDIVFSFLNLANDNGDGDGDDNDDNNLNFVVEDLVFPSSMGLKTRGQFIGLPKRNDSVYIMGCCDGIILLDLYTGDVVLYNPKIKEFKIIPVSCFQDSFSSSMGFGYDPKSKVYIIVEIVSYGEERQQERLVISPPKAALYALATDSWREIKTDYLETENTFFWPNAFEKYSTGIFYWFGYEEKKDFFDHMERLEEKNTQVIILFDTGDEVFRIVMLPESFNEPACGVYDIRLAFSDQFIALFGFSIFDSINSIQIWVMDDIDSVKGCWRKYLTLEPLEAVQRSLAFWKLDQVLMVAKDGRIVLYNLVTGKLKYFPIHGLFLGDDFQAIICVDSIVAVKGRQ